MKQYKELSEKRMEIYQKAQKQRIQKMKRQYEFDKRVNMKERENTEWVDQRRKALMAEQMNIIQRKQEYN